MGIKMQLNILFTVLLSLVTAAKKKTGSKHEVEVSTITSAQIAKPKPRFGNATDAAAAAKQVDENPEKPKKKSKSVKNADGVVSEKTDESNKHAKNPSKDELLQKLVMKNAKSIAHLIKELNEVIPEIENRISILEQGQESETSDEVEETNNTGESDDSETKGLLDLLNRQ